MESGYLWGGTVAGLVALVVLGVVFAMQGAKLRESLRPYVGEQPARWLLYGAWFVYGYGLLSAVSQGYHAILEGMGEHAPPSAISFGYGLVGRSLLWFVSAAVPVLQLVALLVVVALLFRHLDQSKPDREDER